MLNTDKWEKTVHYLLLSFLHTELRCIEDAQSHGAVDAAVQYLLHPVLVSEPQLAQLVAVRLHARQHLGPDTNSLENFTTNHLARLRIIQETIHGRSWQDVSGK